MTTNNIIDKSRLESKKAMILILAKMNADRELLLAMCDMAGIKITTEQSKYLRGPVMHSKSCWATNTPAWLTENVVHARLTQIFAEGETPSRLLATPLEVAIVMSALSFEHPLQSEWVNVATWAAHHAYKCYGSGQVSDAVWQQIAPEKLTPYEQEQYFNYLASDIRSKAVKQAKYLRPIKWPRLEAEPEPEPKETQDLWMFGG